ncbi:MAG: PIN domain-containing protein, partial [Acidimicrobiales bacterium]
MKLYLDSSALVKLVQRETESGALRRFLRRQRVDQLVTSALARVEVVRAVLPGGPAALAQARRQLSRLDQIMLSTEVLDRAATLAPSVQLRS